MKRMLPHPLLSAALVAGWLALNGWSAAHAALAVVLAVAIPLGAAPLMNPAPQRVRLAPALRLLAIVLWDIGVANVRVARLVLGRMDVLRPAFVTVPLDARSVNAAALLARLITITPGTTTVGVRRGDRELLVHVLHTDDPQALVANIKARYERPLMEIFEC